MATHERKRLGDVVLYQLDHRYCCQLRTVEGAGAGSGIALQIGEVLVDGTGAKVTPVGAEDGADWEAILLEPVKASDNEVDQDRLCLVRGPAVLNGSQLTYQDDTQKAEAIAAMKTALVIVRDEPTSSVQQT